MRQQLLIPVILLSACGSEIETVTWDRIDLDVLSASLANPTAELSSIDLSPEAVAELGRQAKAVRGIKAGVDRLADTGDDVIPAEEDLPPETNDDSVVFVELACPGPDLDDRVLDFSQGWIRLDLAQSLVQIYESMTIAGDFLVTFEECTTGDVLIRGASPGFLELEGRLALMLDVTVIDPAGRFELATSAVFEDETILFQILSGSQETYTVRVELSNATQIGIEAADGRVVCNVADSTCTML